MSTRDPPPIPPRPKTKPVYGSAVSFDASRLCNREIKSSIDYYYLVNCLIDKKFTQDTAPPYPSTQSVEVVNMVNELEKIEELRNFFSDFKKIGSESAFGTVYSACVKGLSEECYTQSAKEGAKKLRVAIKFQKLTPTEQSDFLNPKFNSTESRGIWNEIYISYKLSYVSAQNAPNFPPNFPILYRTFFSKLCFENTIEKITYEDDPDPKFPRKRVPCVMIVNELSDGDFGEFFPPKSTDVKSFESAYLQIYMAIIAMQLNGVVHNDLYPKNILYTKVPDEKWKYSIEIGDKTTSFIIPTNGYLFKICDFGKSSINSKPFDYNTDIIRITNEAINSYSLNAKFLNVLNTEYKSTLDFVNTLRAQFKEYLAEKKPNEIINQSWLLKSKIAF